VEERAHASNTESEELRSQLNYKTFEHQELKTQNQRVLGEHQQSQSDWSKER